MATKADELVDRVSWRMLEADPTRRICAGPAPCYPFPQQCSCTSNLNELARVAIAEIKGKPPPSSFPYERRVKVSSLIETVARCLYESDRFKKGWEHPDTVRLWHPVMKRYAAAAILAVRNHDRERATLRERNKLQKVAA